MKTTGLSMHSLSKSKFLAGWQCPKRLWLEVHESNLAAPISATQQSIFDQGIQVGEKARDQFPSGVLIEADQFHIQEALDQTSHALAIQTDIIFEGAFEFDGVVVRPDILRRNNNQWESIEVKQSAKLKDEHIPDVAIQHYVLEGTGLTVVRDSLMRINNQCVSPDLSSLFTIEDITGKVKTYSDAVAPKVAEFHEISKLAEAPDAKIGKQCGNPHECPFKAHCWNWVPDNSIYTVPRLSWDKKDHLSDAGVIKIVDLPDGYRLTPAQERYVASVMNAEPDIDWAGIGGKLSELQFPIHFLDFETDGPAIPRFNGMRPYEKYPFQFSCHVLSEVSSLLHKEYLHEEKSDPRETILHTLLDTINQSGSVVVYHASFEKGILGAMTNWFHGYAPQIQSIIDRIWDLEIIFKNHYMDYRFGGSTSFKNVLPVVVPTMSYQDLPVHRGDDAQAVWNNMIVLPEGEEKTKLISNLKQYCGQDTLGMVEIYKVLAAH